MLKSVDRRTAFVSVLLSVGVALSVSGVARFVLLGIQWLAA